MIFQAGESECFPGIFRIGSVEKREVLPLNPSAAGCPFSSYVEEARRRGSICRGEEKKKRDMENHSTIYVPE